MGCKRNVCVNAFIKHLLASWCIDLADADILLPDLTLGTDTSLFPTIGDGPKSTHVHSHPHADSLESCRLSLGFVA